MTRSKKTAQTQRFIELVDDAIDTITLAAEQFSAGLNENVVNSLCDGAIISLNMFAVSCDQLSKERNKNALKLGRKRVHDRLSELESKNIKVYELIEPHRNFMHAVLDGQKNLRYSTHRVVPGMDKLFQNPENINRAYGDLIKSTQEFDKRQEAMLEPETNKKLAAQHQAQLNEYDSNDNKYKTSSRSKKGKAKVTDLYYTQSGKASKFVDSKANKRKKRQQEEKDAMDEDTFGPEADIYDELIKRPFMNAVLLLSPQMKWMDIDEPIPCKILVPTKDQRAKQNKNEVKILPCYPNNNCTLNATLDILELRVTEIKRIENKYIKNLKKYSMNVPDPALGYKSIEEQTNGMDLDNY